MRPYATVTWFHVPASSNRASVGPCSRHASKWSSSRRRGSPIWVPSMNSCASRSSDDTNRAAIFNSRASRSAAAKRSARSRRMSRRNAVPAEIAPPRATAVSVATSPTSADGTPRVRQNRPGMGTDWLCGHSRPGKVPIERRRKRRRAVRTRRAGSRREDRRHRLVGEYVHDRLGEQARHRRMVMLFVRGSIGTVSVTTIPASPHCRTAPEHPPQDPVSRDQTVAPARAPEPASSVPPSDHVVPTSATLRPRARD